MNEYCFIQTNDIPIRGIMHIGAGFCKQKNIYETLTKNIYWIEGNADLAQIISKFHSKVINVVISNVNKVKDFYIQFNDNYKGSLLKKKDQPNNETHISKCVTETLDSLYSKLDNPDVNMIVLSCRGAELLVLEEGKNMLPNIDYILTKIDINSPYKDGCNLKELDDFLSQFNFVRLHTSFTTNSHGQALYTRLLTC